MKILDEVCPRWHGAEPLKLSERVAMLVERVRVSIVSDVKK
jgi:hypothetical protein